MPEPALRLEMFGEMRLLRDGEAILRFTPSRPAALLAWLALYPNRAAHRQTLAGRLWPELDAVSARNNLRQALAALRADLKAAALPTESLFDTDRDSLRLASGVLTTDVAAFEQYMEAAAKAGEPQERIARLACAVELATGELLPGFADAWIGEKREELRRDALSAQQQLAAAYEQAGERQQALEQGLRALKADPLHEENTALLMRVYAQTNRPALALRQYQELERLLKTHLDTSPGEELRQWAERLRSEIALNGKRAAVPTTIPLPLPAPALLDDAAQEPSATPAALPLADGADLAAAPMPAPLSAAPAPPASIPVVSDPKARSVGQVERACWLALTVCLLAWHFLPARLPENAPHGKPGPPPASQAVLTGIPASKIPLASLRIVFESQRDGPYHLFRMDADGAHVVPLTNTPLSDFHPSVSRDGKQIAFMRLSGSTRNLYCMDADGGHVHPLTRDVDLSDDPAWSPDGRYLAFETMRDGVYQIYVMNPDGTEPRRVTHSANVSRHPRWSPDSKRIAFQEQINKNCVISAIDIDGSHAVQLTHTEGNSVDGFPAWSPDGNHIAFTSTHPAHSDRYNLYVMDSDGSHPVRLTDAQESVEFPAWSPDGAWLAFMSDRAGDYELYALHPGDAQPLRLTYSKGQDNHAAWFMPLRAPAR